MISFDIKSWEGTDALQDGEFVRLPAGGYVCIVLNATVEKSSKGTLQLILTLDIAEGEFAQTFKDSTRPPKLFKPIFINGNKLSPYFKGLIKNFIDSNANYRFNGGNFDERNLIGKKIGMIFRDEQRVWNDKIYTDAKPYSAVTVEKIRSGDFTIPPMKTVEKPTNTAEKSFDEEFRGTDIPDEAVPF